MAYGIYKDIKLFLLLREEHRLGVFENSMLREIFGHKWDKLT
jgi:hypothetical protein